MGCPECSGNRKLAKYNFTQQEYRSLHSVNIEQKCNGVTVLNAGNTVATWNGIPIAPGVSLTIGGNQGEEFIGRVDINFYLPTPAPATPQNSAWVIQKFYVGDNYII
jgi:hypothetical protein